LAVAIESIIMMIIMMIITHTQLHCNFDLTDLIDLVLQESTLDSPSRPQGPGELWLRDVEDGDNQVMPPSTTEFDQGPDTPAVSMTLVNQQQRCSRPRKSCLISPAGSWHRHAPN
jgi:hypothetical protein